MLLPKEEQADEKPGDIDKDGNKLGDIDPKTKKPFVKGTERPDNVPEKFWNKEKKELNVEALLKSYKELEKKMSGKKKGEEEEGDGADNKNNNDQVPAAITEALKNLGLKPEQSVDLIKILKENILPDLAKDKAQIEKEKLKLSWGTKEEKDYNDRITSISEWGKANLDPIVLTELGSSAEGIKAIEALMVAGNKKMQLEKGDPDKSGNKKVTRGELMEMISDERYRTSREFRNQVMKLAENVI